MSECCLMLDWADVAIYSPAARLHIGSRAAQEHHRSRHVADHDGRKVQGFGAGDHAGGHHVRL